MRNVGLSPCVILAHFSMWHLNRIERQPFYWNPPKPFYFFIQKSPRFRLIPIEWMDNWYFWWTWNSSGSVVIVFRFCANCVATRNSIDHMLSSMSTFINRSSSFIVAHTQIYGVHALVQVQWAPVRTTGNYYFYYECLLLRHNECERWFCGRSEFDLRISQYYEL